MKLFIIIPKIKNPKLILSYIQKKIKEYSEKSSKDDIIIGDIINDFNNNAPFFYFISVLSYLFLNCPFSVKNVNYFASKTKPTKFILRRNETKVQDYRNLLMTTIKKTEKNEGGKETNGLMTNFNDKNKIKMDAIIKIGKKNYFNQKEVLLKK